MTIALNATGDGLEAGRPGISHSRRGAKEDRTTLLLLTTQLVVLIYLQKISFPVSPIWAPMVFCFLMLLPSLNSGALKINPRRFVIYFLFAAAAVCSQAFVYNNAWTSMSLVLVLNSILILEWNLDATEYLKLCRNFSTCMVIPCILVLVQFVYELRHGDGVSLSLDPFLPKAFLTEGYLAESSNEHWITWNRPNGLLFLEPSFCSAYLAVAVLLEVNNLRRYLRAAFFMVGLLAVNGGTGFLILLVGAIFSGLKRQPVVTIGVAIFAIASFALLGGVTDLPLFSRFNELSDSDSSGYGRLLQPLLGLTDLLIQPQYFVTGHGAGEITSDYGNAWPATKLVYEYGTLTALIYLALVLSWFQWRTNPPLAVALFVVFQFTGGYLVNPFIILLIFCLCAGHVYSRVTH